MSIRQPKEYHATGKELQAEVLKVTGQKYDPGYLLNIQNGNRTHSILEGLIAKYRSRMLRKQAATPAVP